MLQRPWQPITTGNHREKKWKHPRTSFFLGWFWNGNHMPGYRRTKKKLDKKRPCFSKAAVQRIKREILAENQRSKKSKQSPRTTKAWKQRKVCCVSSVVDGGFFLRFALQFGQHTNKFYFSWFLCISFSPPKVFEIFLMVEFFLSVQVP